MNKSKGINMDLIAGIMCTLVGSLALYASRTYPKLSRDDLIVGADLFPTIAAVGMLVCGVIVLVKAIVSPKYRPAFSAEEKKDYLRVLIVAALCLAYVFLMPKIGFLIAGVPVMLGVMLAYGNRNKLQLILVSILTPLVLFIIFKFVLGVQLPMGWLKFLGI